MGLISLCARICRIYRFHIWSLVQSQDSLNHSQDTQVIVKNLGVNHRWSFGGSAKNHRPSDLMWSGNNVHIRRTKKPLLRGKLCSEDSVKVTGARGVEHCLCDKILIYLAWDLAARPSSWQKETWWPFQVQKQNFLVSTFACVSESLSFNSLHT